MQRHLASRLLGLPIALLGVSVLTFLFLRLIPGDAIAVRLGTSTVLTPQQMAEMRAYLGLDRPLYLQYLHWLGALLRGDAGYSLRSGQPVLSEIVSPAPGHRRAGGLAAAPGPGRGGTAGDPSAVRPNGRLDFLARTLGLVGLSLPVFWLGTLLILGLARYARWCPTPGASPGPWRTPGPTSGS